MFENAENLNVRAVELASQGLYDEAVACLKRAVVIDKANYILWYNLGITYRDSGDLGNAKKALLQAYNLNSEDEELLETLSLVSFSQDDYDDAFAYCYECLNLNSMNYHAWNNLGVFFFTKHEYQKASEAFETSISINPTYYDSLLNLRDTFSEMGDKKATSECDICLKNARKDGFYQQ